MSLVNALQTSNTTTENGMVTNSSTLKATLDLFFVIGAMRKQVYSEEGRVRLISKFESARNEDTLITKKILFWSRDVRGGAGERNIFRILIAYIAKNYPEDLIDNIDLIPEYGRWDDLFSLFDTRLESVAIQTIVKGLKEENALCAKWMPRLGGKVSSENKRIANKIRTEMNLTPKEYRKMLVRLSNVVETKMCSKEFDTIEYEKVPSLAISRYSNSFDNNDRERFVQYKKDLSEGKVKINTGAIYPYNVITSIFNGDEELANEQWKSLPNYMEDNVERVLPVCDVSGSMMTEVSKNLSALQVCLSLGLYISERNEGPFKDAFITFSEEPKLNYLTGDLKSRLKQLTHADWGFSTNIEATFDHLLHQAVKHSVKPEEMPTTLLIFSDMEFNQATRGDSTALDMIREKYTKSGYDLPKIVFWNLVSRRDNFPAQSEDEGISLVSGFSPSILKKVLSGKTVNPVDLMLEVINSDRYSLIK